MIVIVEGSDLVGKSTLVDRLAHDEAWPVVKIRWDLAGDPRVETEAMAKVTLTMLRALRPNVIFDRSFLSWWAYGFLSWWAYGPPLGHPVEFMPDLICKFADVPDVCVVVLTADADDLARRYTLAPDRWFSVEVIQAANERFKTLPSLLPTGVSRLHIDTTHTSPDDAYEQLRTFMASGTAPTI